MGKTLNVQQIIEEVARYQYIVHGINYTTLTARQRITMMREYVLAMHMEQAELLNECPWKPWKYAESLIENTMTLKTPEVIAEWADCLFFLIDQALVLGITTEDITETFFAVLTKNYERSKRKEVPK